MEVRLPCSPVDRGPLLEKISALVTACLDQCGRADNDLARVEEAVGKAVAEFTKLMRQAGVDESMSQPMVWQCPECRRFLGYHDVRTKGIVVRQGPVDLHRGRYRCAACKREYLPVDVLNDLQESTFSLGAREVGVAQAVQRAFAPASEAIKPQLPISAKSLERMVVQAAGWVRAEQKAAVDAYFGDRTVPGLLPAGMVKPLVTAWEPMELPEDAVLCIAADGGYVRSTTLGKDGRLEWFLARTATISVTSQGKELPLKVSGGKFYLSGTLELDELFDLMGVAHATLPARLQALPSVFTGDGDHWWERAREYFSQARDILDIYHAGEHLGAAAALCFGDGEARTRQWRDQARDWLKEPGKLEELIGELFRARPSVKADPEAHHELLNHIAYFRKHRGRMRYWEYEALGLPIGSGVVESGIKQTVIGRMRQAGMKWTRKHADDMLRLRGSMLSGELAGVFQRRRQACLEAARAFDETLAKAA